MQRTLFSMFVRRFLPGVGATALAGALLLATGGPASAAVARPSVAVIAPATGAQGLPLFVTGKSLKPVTKLFFYPDPMRKGSHKRSLAKDIFAEKVTTQFSFTVPKLPAGRYELAVRTRHGLSNKKVFRVVADASYRAGESCPGEWGDLVITVAKKTQLECAILAKGKLRWERVSKANAGTGTTTGTTTTTTTTTATTTATANALHQTSTTSDSIPAGDPYSGALTTNSPGQVTFVTTSPSEWISVSSTGVISAPDTVPAGTYAVSGTDSDNLGNSGTWTFTLTETAGSIVQTSTTTDSVPAGSAYSSQLSTNSPGTVTYTTTVKSADVTVTASGVISVSDTVRAGTYAVSGTDADDLGNTGTWTFTLTITPGTITQAAATTTGTTAAGSAYSGQLETNSPVTSVTYTTTVRSAEVTVSSSGVVSAPATLLVGSYLVSGTDTDSLGNTGTWSFTLTVTAVTIDQTAATTTGATTAGAAYAGQLETDGIGTVTFVTTSASADVTVSSSGAVSAPDTDVAGSYLVSGTDSDSLGDTGTWSFTLTVTAVTIDQTAATTTGATTAGTAYAGQLETDGIGTVTFVTTSASADVTVSSSGAVSAPDTDVAGSYLVSGTDSDSLGDIGTWTFTLTVSD